MLTIGQGVLRCPDAHKLVVEVDPEITAYARALVPHLYRVRPQRWPAHITVVRNEILRGDAKDLDGRAIEFQYDPRIRNDDVYWWLDVYAPSLGDLRVSLGLPESSQWTRPPDGRECFHMTVGNTKHDRR